MVNVPFALNNQVLNSDPYKEPLTIGGPGGGEGRGRQVTCAGEEGEGKEGRRGEERKVREGT